MCGLVGIASSATVMQRSWVHCGAETMHHRGPDDSGEWWSPDGRVGLAHRRLAIVDLSPAGHQPMLDIAGELCIVFNGEIYNFQELRSELIGKGHRFRSNSDTEVLLEAYRAWGIDCIHRLNGMFVFALYDTRTAELFMARDRAGEKPLYYTFQEGSLRFSSELKGLMADPNLPRIIDPASLDCYLTLGFIPAERCILRGVKKLPPAHALLFNTNTGRKRTWRYWKPPGAFAAGEGTNEQDLLTQLETLLQEAVRRQLVADVPVGILLSGGIDSSLITAMAAHTMRNVRTYTIRFPGYGSYDETDHARLIAGHFGTEHTELEAAESSIDLLPRLARQFDEPLIDSSMIPTFLVSEAVRTHCTVALGGDGGDELFGGYSSYKRLLRLQMATGKIPRSVRKVVASAAGTVLPVGFRGRNWAQSMAADYRSEQPPFAVFFDRQTRHRLLNSYPDWPFMGEGVQNERTLPTPDMLQRATRLDFENYLPEDILVKVDRASMLSSLEVRAPFLDVRLIEFAFGNVPSDQKATHRDHKVLLKRLCKKLLPPTFDLQRKQGFSIPLESWIRSESWAAFFQAILLDDSQTVFNRKYIKTLVESSSKRRANGERLFGLVMFELWRREYGANL